MSNQVDQSQELSTETDESPHSAPAQGMVSKNAKTLEQFTAYCRAYPQLRFWQALAAWSGFHRVSVTGVAGEEYDTFYWEGRVPTKHNDEARLSGDSVAK